jgi:hypothetical protein
MTEENHNSHDFPDSVVSKKIGGGNTRDVENTSQYPRALEIFQVETK